jgi:hypothetical protein
VRGGFEQHLHARDLGVSGQSGAADVRQWHAGLQDRVSRNAKSASPNVKSLPAVIRALFESRAANCTYIASGLMMFTRASIVAWIPSYLNRYYAMNPADAGVRAGVLVLIAGVGMTLGGFVVDRLSASRPANRSRIPALYAVASGAILLIAFMLPPGGAQFALIARGSMSRCTWCRSRASRLLCSSCPPPARSLPRPATRGEGVNWCSRTSPRSWCSDCATHPHT